MDDISAKNILRDVSSLVMSNLDRVEATRYNISWKADGSPVTESDVFLEETIKNFLVDRIPNLVFVGEESFVEGNSLEGEYIAILDPIDGTENFCSGLKEWGTSFGLWQGDKHLGSMLMLPELGMRLATGDEIVPIKSRITGFSSSFSEEILEQMRGLTESRISGCAVYNLFNVIRGSFTRFCNPKGASAWDLLPGLMLALEHGCDVKVEGKPFDGRFLDPNRKHRVDIQHR